MHALMRMKRIKLFIHEPSINRIIGRELNLLLDDKASLVDAIREVDKIINSTGSFPVSNYRSLLHMIYNPVQNKFYKQVAITAYNQSGQMLNVRDDPKKELPEGTTVTLIPAGGCITEWEKAINYEEFLKSTSQQAFALSH
jgi:hypothetical protein